MFQTNIDHPDRFKTGTRLLMLKSRNKDKADKIPTVTKISHSPEEFNVALSQLKAAHKPKQRIYASASPRDVHKAAKMFKLRQIEAQYSGELGFYKKVLSQWESCLQATTSQVKSQKMWLFDCDTEEEYQTIWPHLVEQHLEEQAYVYPTKTGRHIITEPFNTHKLGTAADSFHHRNALMLWTY